MQPTLQGISPDHAAGVAGDDQLFRTGHGEDVVRKAQTEVFGRELFRRGVAARNIVRRVGGQWRGPGGKDPNDSAFGNDDSVIL